MSKRLSPSMLENKSICPCFDYIERDVDDEDNVAEEGILLHKACETGDMSQLDEEQRLTVEKALSYVAGVLDGHLAESIESDRKEWKFKMSVLDGNGIIDRAVILKDGLVEIFDYKFGRLPVEHPETNKQFFAYVVSIFDTLPESQKIRAHIVQPRLNEAPEPFVFDRTMVPGIVSSIEFIKQCVDDPFKVPIARDPSLCTKCAHKARCRAFGGLVPVVMQGVADPELFPSIWDAGLMNNPVDMARAQVLAVAMEDWSKSIKQHNTAYVKAGGEIPGYKLVSRQGTKELGDPVQVTERLRETGTLADFDIISTAKLSFAKLAEKMSELSDISKEEARSRLEAILGTLVTDGYPVEFLQKTKVKQIKGEQ